MTAPVIETIGLAKEYRVGARRVLALRGIDLELGRGEIVAVVGESGSGKTTLGNLVLGIEQPTAGSIRLNDMVGLAPALLDRHPQVLSGGQRQRVALARAIAAEPQALVLDEPTSALDVSVQARVLELLAELRRRLGLSYLFITHDLGIVRVLAHRVVVLFRGRIVEAGPTALVFASPRHRYTQMLISSVPVVTEAEERLKPHWPWDRAIGTGEAVAATGCPFRPRCPHAVAACEHSEPALTELAPGHVASCHNPARDPTPA